MRSFKVLESIILGFIEDNEQVDIYIDPGTTLEANDETIWVITKDGKRVESITTANAVDVFTQDGKLVETTAV